MSSDRYSELIDSMAREVESNGEFPNKYSDEFIECASESFKKEKDFLYIKGLLAFDAIIKGDKKDGKLIDMISSYMKEESDIVKRIMTVDICELIADNVINFYEEDISDDVKKSYKRKYCDNNFNYQNYEPTEQLPHCG